MTTRIQLKNVRIAFPRLFTPERVDEQGSYRRGALFIIDGADTAQLATVNAAIEAAGALKWKEKAPAILKQLTAQDRLCLHNGDTKAQYDGFPGNWFVSANGQGAALPEDAGAVTVIDQYRRPLAERDGRPYSGSYVNAIIEIYGQDSPKYGKRVNASLKGVQFWADGPAFGSGPPATADDFEAADAPDATDWADDLV